MQSWMFIAAAILAPGGVIVALIERTRRENNRDHVTSVSLLKTIDRKVDKLDDRLDNHINWHMDKEK